MIEINALIVATLICFPAVLFAIRGSSWLVDYLFFVVALNRGIRRVVDYQNGFFNPYSLISLTPIIVGGLATLVVVIELQRRSNRFGASTIRAIQIYGIATAMAFVVGLVNVRFGAIYALGDYIAPVGLLGFGALYSDRRDIVNRWCQSLALSVLVVAVYGIYQFYTIPPWDAFWVREVDFEGYLGVLEPTKMTLFSTMAERGPASFYLCGGLILLILRPGTLGKFRWTSAGIILIAMLLTYSRTTVIQVSLAVLLYPLVNRGAGWLPVLSLCLVVVFLGNSLISNMPGTEMAASRVSTIGNLPNDNSLIGRIGIMKIALVESLNQPLGLGIGAYGLASRVGTANTIGRGDSSGYLETLATFGWLGFALIAYFMYRLWASSQELSSAKMDDENIRLLRVWFLSGMAAFFSGNWLFTATFFWVLAGYSLGRLASHKFHELSHEQLMAYGKPVETSALSIHQKPQTKHIMPGI